MAAARSDERSTEPSGESLVGYIWRLTGRQQTGLILLTALLFPLTMAPLELQRRIVNDAIGGSDLRWLFMLGGAYLAVVVLQGGLKYALRIWRGRLSEQVIRRMRQRMALTAIEHARDGQRDEGITEGEMIPMMAKEVERVGGFIGASFSEPTLQAGILLSIVGYMLVVEPVVALVSLGFFVPQLALVPLIQRALNRRTRDKVRIIRELGERVADQQLCTEHDDQIEQIYTNRLGYYRLKFLLKLLTNLLNHLAPISVLMVGGYSVIEGQTTVGTVVAFITGFERMADPARQLLAHYRLAAEAGVQYRLLATRLAL
jgi:ABC-type bacteriocin/lantibiotic exporter with double-glycine peptidase domain